MEPVNVAYNMDCMEYMRSLPDKAFDLAVVDPPYGDGNSQSVHAEREREREAGYNRFGGWWNRYEEIQPIRPAVRQVQESHGGGITGRTNTTWDNPDRGNLGQQVRQKNYSVGHGPG